MIIALVILLLFAGGFGASHIDLSDPVVLVKFRRSISEIIEDPVRAANVTNAIYDLNIMSSQTRSENGAVEKEIKDFRAIAGNYKATPAEVHTALRELEGSLTSAKQSTIEGREIIRRNTTKKEWKKLIKALAKK